MPVQTRSTRVKAPAISDPDNVPVEALSTNEKTTLNLSGGVGFDGPLEGSSVNHENDYYKILKFINKSKFTFTDVDNENNKGLIHKCNSKQKCALCVNLKPIDSFHSILTHRKYDDKNINTLNCSTSNCIYLITCCRCGLQYVGETVKSLRDRISGHRTGMKNPFADRCKILGKHFGVGLFRNANYIVNIIEYLSGSGRDDNCIPIPGVKVERQKKETKWMLTLQTVYPYGLNHRVGDEYMAEKDSGVVGSKFLPLHRLYKRLEYNYSKSKLDNSFLKRNFVKILTTHLDHNLKDTGYFTRVSLKSFKKYFLKHVCNDVYDFLSSKADSFPNQQWYEITLDLIESRIYNPPASKTTKTKPKKLNKLYFVNKGMDMIDISKIIND